jgi:uncharacterized protein
MESFLGSGWSFPPQTDGRGGLALVSGEEDVRQAIAIILGTPIGQRVMRPTFGSRLHELIFAPANSDTFGLAETYVEEALTFWEPRIEVLDVTAGLKGERAHVIEIVIAFRIKATHDERSLVYPFYQIPGE